MWQLIRPTKTLAPHPNDLIADFPALAAIFTLESRRIDSSKLAPIMCFAFPLLLSYTLSTKAYSQIHSLSPPSTTRRRWGLDFYYAWYGVLGDVGDDSDGRFEESR